MSPSPSSLSSQLQGKSFSMPPSSFSTTSESLEESLTPPPCEIKTKEIKTEQTEGRLALSRRQQEQQAADLTSESTSLFTVSLFSMASSDCSSNQCDQEEEERLREARDQEERKQRQEMSSYIARRTMNISVVPIVELKRLVAENGVSENLDNMYIVMSDIQTCYWKYIDEHKITDLYFKQFALEMFKFLPFLRHLTRIGTFMRVFRDFIREKKRAAVCGGILISRDRKNVLLVQSCRTRQWSFPKGKIEVRDNGDMKKCACREVFEETSFALDLESLDDYIELTVINAMTRMYIVLDVPMDDAVYRPQSEQEILQCKWFNIAELMRSLEEKNPDFSMIRPFYEKFLEKMEQLDVKEKLDAAPAS